MLRTAQMMLAQAFSSLLLSRGTRRFGVCRAWS